MDVPFLIGLQVALRLALVFICLAINRTVATKGKFSLATLLLVMTAIAVAVMSLNLMLTESN